MPRLQMSDGCEIHYRFDGDAGLPVLMFSNPLGFTCEMWSPQLQAATEYFRVLRYDARGHGLSDVPHGAYTIERVACDAKELIEGLQVGPVAFCGLSIGGMVGIWLAAKYPHLFTRMILANTSANLGQPHPLKPRIRLIEEQGMGAAVEDIVQRSLSDGYRQQNPGVTATYTEMLNGMSAAGYTGTGHALVNMDLRACVSEIKTPTLVITGSLDTATTAEMGAAIAQGIADSTLVNLESAHLSNIEQAARFNGVLTEFLLPDLEV